MKTYSISKLARAFGLSRSTLLYYDRIGLLAASGRTGSGYRCYSEKD
jgi:DNA-binding transcriptional MerR regulator